ncbi:MAG: argininosuccinate lyase [Nitrososphaerota archaeon]
MAFRSARLRREMPEKIAAYISSLSFDHEIYQAVLVINAVHLKMLTRLGIISDRTLSRALEALRKALENPLRLDDTRLEDVHMVVEEYLSRIVPEAGENLALGKSRNDTVSTAIRMRAKELCLHLCESAMTLVDRLLEKSLQNLETIYPATTHQQAAAPATLGFILSSYASRLLSTAENLKRIYEGLDLCPQGSAACCGSTLPLDRNLLAQQLGFSGVLENALEASSSRDFAVELAAASLRGLVVASDLVEHLIHDFTAGLLDIGDEFCSTSSIMPQKRNPVVLEVLRTKASEALGELVKISSILQRRIGGYVLDLQQVTPAIWRLMRDADQAFNVLADVMESLDVNRDEALRRCGLEVGMVELANYLVFRHGVGFRRAHRACGELARILAEGGLSETALREVLKKNGISEALSIEEVRAILSPQAIVSAYSTSGSAKPSEVKRMVEAYRKRVSEIRDWITKNRRLLEDVVERAFSTQTG